MRYVEITIPTGRREALLGVLDDEGIDYVVFEEIAGEEFTAVVSFPLPPPAVEPVLDRLREAGLPDDAYTIVLDAETARSPRLEALEERYAEEAGDRIAREEIQARAESLAPGFATYVLMVVVSAVIATAGILLDSAAVVVGSMVIAPLIGPAMATSVGTVVQNRELFARGTKLQLLGFGLAVVSAAAFAVVLKTLHLIPLGAEEVVAIDQVRERLAPDFLSLAVALGAGLAGAYSLASGVSSALVGVMIAVALVPPTAVIGIGIAWGLPTVVLGSTVLVLVNFLSINLAALVVFWYQGYRPGKWFREDAARVATLQRVAALAVAIAVLSTFLGGVTYFSYQSATVEDDVREEIRATFEEPEYRGLALLDVVFETGDPRLRPSGAALVPQPERVVVTVGTPSGARPPGLADDIAARLSHDLAVEVRFVAIARSG